MIPPFFFRKNFSKREILSKTVGFAYKKFRQGETKEFRQKNVIPPIMHKFFRYHKFSETLKGCPRIFSAIRDKKFSTKCCDIPIIHKIFDTRNFLQHWRDAQKIFQDCETENFWRKYVIPSTMDKLFRLPQTFWKLKGRPRPRIFSALCDLKILR